MVISLGEIDCRMYLGSEKADMYRSEFWVDRFLQNSLQLAKDIRVKRIIVLTPVPPSDIARIDERYPRKGTLYDRVDSTKWLTSALMNSKWSSDPTLNILDLSKILSIEDGSLDPKYTDDGVHVNLRGAGVIKQKIVSLVDA
jgi:lysophospholipase L1-like esterase